MAASDVLVLPRPVVSGFPIKLLNYLAAERPIVAAGGACGLIRDEEDGLVVRDRSADAMASAIVRVAADAALRRRLSEGARQRAQSLRWETAIPAIESVYATVVATGKTRGFDRASAKVDVRRGPA
jgi:glycosyltransferase involved in cell wall biosynthesis